MNNAVDVAVTNWTPGAYVGAGSLLIQVMLFAGFFIRGGPAWLKTYFEGRRMKAEDDRIDAAAEAAEQAGLSARVAALEDRLARMSQALNFLTLAATSTINTLESELPSHPAVGQGRELIGFAAAALGNDDPFNKALTKLAGVVGVGEVGKPN